MKTKNYKRKYQLKLYRFFIKKPIEVAISLELGCEETEKIYQQYWRLNNLHILHSIYQELKEEIAKLVDVYYKFKGENRTPEEIKTLIAILQEVSDLEKYIKTLEERIENYERKYRGLI